jgi:histone H3/H4
MKVEQSSRESPDTRDLAKAMPKDAQVMAAILRDMGIMEWEPRVISQLLEFAYGYVTSVLDDAKLVSGHAKKQAVDVEDVRLAVQMYTEQNVTTPPSRDALLEVARAKNTSTLPIPKPTSGLRLPPDRHCLTSCNYRLKHNNKRQPPRPGPYTYTAATASSGGNNVNMNNMKNINMAGKVMIGQPPVIHPPTFMMRPGPGMMTSTQIQRPMQMKIAQPPNANKIQIQPSGGQSMFTMTIQPGGNNSTTATTMKRKADDMS